ncbi:MAG: hypothetical protein LBC42_02735 [Puniceicoccales bacterium]|jgi:hypothetical protein|nr:hypothetical protein [Puniceicoccales bacterium]
MSISRFRLPPSIPDGVVNSFAEVAENRGIQVCAGNCDEYVALLYGVTNRDVSICNFSIPALKGVLIASGMSPLHALIAARFCIFFGFDLNNLRERARVGLEYIVQTNRSLTESASRMFAAGKELLAQHPDMPLYDFLRYVMGDREGLDVVDIIGKIMIALRSTAIDVSRHGITARDFIDSIKVLQHIHGEFCAGKLVLMQRGNFASSIDFLMAETVVDTIFGIGALEDKDFDELAAAVDEFRLRD